MGDEGPASPILDQTPNRRFCVQQDETDVDRVGRQGGCDWIPSFGCLAGGTANATLPAGDDCLELALARKPNPVQYGDTDQSPPGTDDVNSNRSACGGEGVA